MPGALLKKQILTQGEIGYVVAPKGAMGQKAKRHGITEARCYVNGELVISLDEAIHIMIGGTSYNDTGTIHKCNYVVFVWLNCAKDVRRLFASFLLGCQQILVFRKFMLYHEFLNQTQGH